MNRKQLTIVLTLATLAAQVVGCATGSIAPVDDPQTPAPAVVPTAGFDCEQVSEIPPGECQALVAFYQATNGPAWLSDGAPAAASDPTWLHATAPCSWIGVTCTAGHVDMLALYYHNLQGQLPAELAGLTGLRVLDLHNNRIGGPIPAELGRLANLESIDLSANVLSGRIPATLGDLPRLGSLNLANNRLAGPIPAALGDLMALHSLSLTNNELTGPVPESFTALTALQSLRLDGNQLEGPLPQGLAKLPELYEVNLAFNRLAGPVPAGLGSSIYHSLWGNELDGTTVIRGVEPVSLLGVQFTSDPALMAAVWPAQLAAVAPSDGGPWWEAAPAHTRLTFVGSEGPTAHRPMGLNVPGEAQLHVYATAGFDQLYQDQVAQLQQLLSDRPLRPSAPLPFLPPTNAAQQFAAQVEYLAFGNGTGIRYLTALSQGPDPISNDRIFYTFQGLTDDGSAYVALFFPVGTAALPDSAAAAAGTAEMAAILEGGNYPSYEATTVAALNGLDAAGFEPALGSIDGLVGSLIISTSTPTAPMAALPVLEGRWPDNGESVDAEPVLQWQPYAGATQYEVVVVDDDAYPPVVAFSDQTGDTLAAVSPALAPGSYSWTVRAQDADRSVLAELNRQFLVKDAVELLYPPAGEAVDAEPILQWQPHEGASRYQITVVDDEAYPPRVAFEGQSDENFISVSPALARGRHYTWSVWASDERGRIIAELNSDFTVYGDLLLVQPADLAEVAATPLLQWQSFPGAMTYEVVVVTGYPPAVVFEATTSETSLTITPSLTGRDVHYWTVWARDASGRLVAALSSSFVVTG